MALEGMGGRKATPKKVGRAPVGKVSGRATAPAPAPAPQPAPQVGGYSDGGGYGSPAVAAPMAAPAPTPMTDVDWFNQDSVYRGQSGRALTDLTSQLAQILADRDSGYRQLDQSRGELTRGRQQDLTSQGDDFAGRGLLGSGLYAQDADDLSADYARQGSALDNSANQLAQQYGQRDNAVNLGGIGQGANLESIYGLLGAMGIGAGQSYNSALGKARAESAGRATGPLTQTMNW